jgi:hypothetical protein
MNDNKTNNDYPTLSTISVIFKVIGIVILITAVIGIIYGLTLLNNSEDERKVGIEIIITSILSGLILTLPFFAFGELIRLLIRIEYNTRKNTSDSSVIETDSSRYQQKSGFIDKTDKGYDEWKKDNPTKSINDYYAIKKKKN